MSTGNQDRRFLPKRMPLPRSAPVVECEAAVPNLKPLPHSKPMRRCPVQSPEWGMDRDRGTPRDATPPTPPGIRVTYHGGSTGLSLDRNMESGEADRVEVAVGQCLLDSRVS